MMTRQGRRASKLWRGWHSLIRSFLVAGLVVFCVGAGALTQAYGQAGEATVGIVRVDGDSTLYIEQMVRDAVALAGGLDDVISPGDTVVIKPNLVQSVWAPGDGVTTDPRVVSAVVALANEAGAGTVIIAEGSASDPSDPGGDIDHKRQVTWRAFRDSGYDTDSNGLFDYDTSVQLVDLNDAGQFYESPPTSDPANVTLVGLPGSPIIRSEYYIPDVILNADVFITVPTLKNHGQGSVTLSLKNQVGIAPSDIYHYPYSGYLHYQMKWGLVHSVDHGYPWDIPPAPTGGENEIVRRTIVDLNLASQPDFAVIDGLVGITNGPTGTDKPNPLMRMVLAGRNLVALDTMGTLVMGYDPASIDQLQYAAGTGLLGTADVADITALGKSVDNVRAPLNDTDGFDDGYGGAQRIPDTTPPTMTTMSLLNGELVSGVKTITSSGSDNVGVVKTDLEAYRIDGNLLLNGDFEAGSSGWQTWQSTWGSNFAWDFYSTEAGHLGSYCLKLGGGSTRGSFGAYQQATVEAGKTYRLDVYWKGQKLSTDNISWWEVLLIDGPFDMDQADTGGGAVVEANYMYAYDNYTYGLPGSAFGWIWGHDQYSPPKNRVDWNDRRGQRTASSSVLTVVLKAGTLGTTGVAAWFDEVRLTEVGTERSFVSARSANLDWDVRSIDGGEYEVTVSAYDACLNDARASRTVTVGASTEAGFYTPGWNLTSIPVSAYDPEASAVFQDLIDVGNTITDRLYRYDAGVGYAIYPSAFTELDNLEHTRGYWLYVTVTGQDFLLGQVAKDDVERELDPGWNLIGYPFQQPQLLSNCWVSDGETTVSFSDASLIGWVGATLYYWDPSAGYRALNSAGYGDDDTLRPWLGYWVYAREAGYTLTVPMPTG